MLDRFKAFSLRQQIALIGAALGLFALLIGAIWYFGLRTTYQPLFSGLRTGDAAAIVADLDRRKIAYRLADGGTTILVASDKADATRLDVAGADLPVNGTVGFELFNKSDMGLTDFAQKINYQRALQGELERTIMTLDGIDTARVHLSLSEDRIFREDRVPPKASVTVRMQKGRRLSAAAADGIRRLVAAAVSKLDAADVVVLDDSGNEVVPTAKHDGSASGLSPADEEKRAIAQYYESRVRDVLDRSFAPGSIAVTITADGPAPAAVSAASGPALVDFNPAQRDYPLRVTLAPLTPLDAQMEQNVRSAVAAAIGSDAAKQDTIAFSVRTAAPPSAPPTLVAPPANWSRAMLPPATATPFDMRAFLLLISLPVLLLSSIASLILFVRQIRRPRRLSKVRRADLATKLKALLQEGDAGAAAS